MFEWMCVRVLLVCIVIGEFFFLFLSVKKIRENPKRPCETIFFHNSREKTPRSPISWEAFSPRAYRPHREPRPPSPPLSREEAKKYKGRIVGHKICIYHYFTIPYCLHFNCQNKIKLKKRSYWAYNAHIYHDHARWHILTFS